MTTYRQTQAGRVILIALAIAALIVLETAPRTGPVAALPWVVTGILLVSAVLFASLTIEIGDGRLRWRFGPGWIRKSVAIADIEHVQAVRNSWIYGWGIHLTPQGWLYNVSGLDAVQVRLKNGKQFRLGTAEPDRLVAALVEAGVGEGDVREGYKS